MKRLTSLLLCLTMLLSVFTFPVGAASAKQAAVYGDDVIFAADFDVINPAATKTDSNASVEASNDGNAVVVKKADTRIGIQYATKSFTLSNDMIVKFDLVDNDAACNFQIELWDNTSAGKAFRINKSTTSSVEGVWYTYIVVLGSTTAYRKAAGSNTWETVAINSPGKSTDVVSNTIKFVSGSGASGGSSSGKWQVDNVSVYTQKPAISAIMPADLSKTHPVYVANEGFEDATNIFTNVSTNAAKTTISTVDPSNESDDTVLDINLSTQTAFGAYHSTYYKSRDLNFPEEPSRFTISFDFRRLNDAFTAEAIGVVTGVGPTAASRASYEFTIEQFEKGEWYNISYDIYETGSDAGIDSATLTATKLSDGSKLATVNYVRGDEWSSSLCDLLTLYPTVTSADMYSSMDRAKAHYQFDNIKISYETSDPIQTELLTTATSGAVQPLLVGYDKNGVVTKVKAGTAANIATISTFGSTAMADFDVYADITDWQNAKSVKVLYWDGYANAKAYAPYVEIGDAISSAVSQTTAVAETLNITNDMIPSDATGNYTVFAYATSFAATADEIPAYDSATNKILVLDQFSSKPTSVKYDKSLYDGSSQDIVVVVNADGASAAKVTLLEEVDPPKITNVVMQLGADESQRNFTWFSLKEDAGKLTYAKAEDLVDGAFPNNATVLTATRDSAEGEYSLKAFYYNNKTTITGLEPNTKYYYQISNGTDKTDMIPFTTGTDGSSFSFAFGGDAQVGGSEYVDYDKEIETWGRSVKQMVNESEFSGIEFFVHGGDQVDSCDRTDGTEEDAEWDIEEEKQYDIYTSPKEFLSLPMVVTYGNHDLKSQGRHYQHFNEPNLPALSSILDESAAGAATFMAADGTVYPQSADHYFTYKSALFIVLNTNTFKSSKTYSTTVEETNKASAKNHAAFVKAITDRYKDDPEIMWTIVLYHQSPYGSSYHGNYKYTTDEKGTITFGRSEQQAYIDMRKYLLPALDECGVDMVLSGHDHVYTRTHIIKPETDENGAYTYADNAIVTPYTDGNYTFADGTVIPTYNTAWKDANGVAWPYLQVISKPVKVTNPDGILHVTGATSSGSQVNGLEYTNRFTAVNAEAVTRHLSRIDITPNSLVLKTYNLGTQNEEEVTLVDEFTIERTAEVEVQGINFDESEVTVATGITKTLGYSFVPAEPTDKAVTWSSDAESVATVKDGVVTGVSAGVANITVRTANGKTATCKVNVVDKIAVTGITLPATLTMQALTTKTLTATVAPDNASEKGLEWTSSDDKIATVNQNGSVTAHKNGTVTITATAKDGSGVSASCTVTVTYVASTATLPASLSMAVNSDAQLSVSITPSNATFKDFVWASSASDVVTVDQNGKLRAYKRGTANITATTPERTLTCVVTVTGTVLFEQNFENSTDTTFYDNFYLGEVGWKRIQDEDGNWVVDMDQKDLTKGFTGIINSRSQSPANTVIMPPESGYTVDFDLRRVTTDGLGAINFRAYDQNGYWAGFKIDIRNFEAGEWYDIRVVTGIDGNRTLYYKKASSSTWIENDDLLLPKPYNGSSTLGALVNYMDIMAMFINNKSEITTEEQLKTHWQMDNIRTYVDVPATDFALSGTSASMEIGDKYMLNPTFTPSNVTDNHIAYSSSNTAVATVDRFGNIKAVGAGNATITATSSATQKSKTFTVSVASLEPSITLSKTVVGTNWKFTIGSENIVNGDKVYVGAYNSSDALIESGWADYLTAGNELTIPQNGAASYFKAFIWSAENAPCAPFKRIEN